MSQTRPGGASAKRTTSKKGLAPKNPKAEKICPVCERPFHWRARWKNNWDAIVYCSRRCASQRRTLAKKS
ncbi:MAG: DUF2256 domain-containing protein [Congregibacter sp.]|nr:DUF2256 domain-containing protein [Congregibacter sp.]MDP5071378.1 DUF2256 domain-containing protein [Congregibacter sp.]